MKNVFKISTTILILILEISCKKNEKPASLPIVSTTPVTAILYATAVSGGTITDDNGGTITAKGVCWGINSNPTTYDNKTIDGTGSEEYTSSLDGLTSGTKYYVRAYAINSAGTEYGNEMSFTTHVPGVKFNPDLNYGTLIDVEGKSYKTISIGIQIWMAENLRTTKFSDGSTIPLITNSADWSNIQTAAYCWFDNNDSLYENIYGTYYNWFAVSTGKLCPTDWHVPSDAEWQLLVDYLGGNNIAGSKLKEAGTNNWVLPNSDATNASGFTALPAGMRGSFDGAFSGEGNFGGWWSSTESSPSPLGAAFSRWIHGDTTVVARSEIFKKDGFSVRCVKN